MDEGSASSLAPGTVLADRYRIEKILGEGGMGAVYLAEHVHMRKRFAVKVLHPEMSATPEMVTRFEREAIAAGHVAHPNVVAATDFGRLADGSFFLVLEFIDGKSLREVVSAGALDAERALRVTRGILAAVGAAHAKGIVHRDLKPENVMLVEKDGDPDFVKVLDFGIAKIDVYETTGSARTAQGSAAQPLTRVGTVFGTPDYMAPEQAMGEAVDLRADLYAIGIMLFELLTGDRPFQGGAVTVLSQRVVRDPPPLPDAVMAKIDPRIGDVVRRLLAKSASARFASAAEVLAALDGLRATPEPSSGRVPAIVSAGLGLSTNPHAPTALAHPAYAATAAVSVVAPPPSTSRPRMTPARVAILAGAVGLCGTLVVGLAIAGSSGEMEWIGGEPHARHALAYQADLEDSAPADATATPPAAAHHAPAGTAHAAPPPPVKKVGGGGNNNRGSGGIRLPHIRFGR